MSRIVKLSTEEIEQLRSDIILAFKMRNPEADELILNSYLSNYEVLVRDIHLQFPDHAASITTSRLRKLFYYSPKKDISKTSLGIDFVKICRSYAKLSNDSKKDVNDYRKNPILQKLAHHSWFVLIPVILIVLLSVFPISKSESDVKDSSIWEEKFNRNDLVSLQNNGWHVQDMNEGFIHQQRQTGKFTLYTLPGSFWTKPEEAISVPNTLYRSLPKNSCGVRVKFDAFLPYQDWQGIGLCLFDKSMSTADMVFLGFGYSHSVDTTSGTPFVYSAYRLRNGIPDSPFLTYLAYPDFSDGSALRLDISWDENKLYFKVGTNSQGGFSQEWEPFQKVGELHRTFTPEIMGLVACQGWTNDERQPLRADTIPAFIDWVQIY